MKRRDFIKTAALATAGAAALPAAAEAAVKSSSLVQSMNFFSKPLQWMNYDQLAESVAKLGLDGFDLTVRPKGHVLPENVERDLPLAIKAAKAQGLNVDMMVTAITAADNELAEKILKTAAQNGVKCYRMGYLQYDPKKSVLQSLSDINKTMSGLEKINQSAGLTGCYQNHHAWKPGLFGGAIWDLHHVLKDVDPKWMACQYDVRHAIAECTGSWSTGMRLIAPWIKSICLKDFDLKGDRKGRSYPRNLPAGEGETPWKEYAKLLKDLNIKVPATIHIEWEYLSKEEKNLPYAEKTELAINRIKKDCDFYKSVLC
ncbi:MAG: TIM barrel protein [Kiritimatiellae bacterium]|jgi:L-ribulose-5-phosphate 3-epimerase|nr:TIM barrel protein [Kiritimatiellia bacterium]